MRIIVDGFGGDHAPLEVIKGCKQAQDELGVHIVLTGDEARLQEAAKQENIDISGFEILHAPEVFDIHAQPTTILKEGKNTSLAVGLQALHDGKGDAFVSAGSTGGLVAGATFITKRIKNVKRPALAPILPTAKGHMMLMDAGANVDCRPEMLVQFAIMGSAYMERVKGVKNPRVGLLNVGAEETKGRELEQQAYKLLESAPINFVGNAEARELPSGDFDVVVSDGFSGNIALKLYEGMGGFFKNKLKSWFSGAAGKLAAVMILGKIKAFEKSMDYKEEGGAVLMGIAAPVIKAHGSSDSRAFYNAVRQAKKCVEGNITATIAQTVAEMKGE
ncbi:MAG: phosphate acyltransferase PlsX [Oscillospiraceae bacterium]|nr:phosphate acyltransferase PlsX [Oscillospiraceae bacterium]